MGDQKIMGYVSRPKMVQKSFISEGAKLAFLGNSQKGNLIDYISRPKIIIKFFLWDGIIALLRNSQRGNFDELYKRSQNNEFFIFPRRHDSLFSVLFNYIIYQIFQNRKFDGTHIPCPVDHKACV